MKKSKTPRGFSVIEFKDINGDEASIQKSSIATKDCIWLGLSGDPKQHLGQWLGQRMHIDKPLAKKLVKHLTKFIETGDL